MNVAPEGDIAGDGGGHVLGALKGDNRLVVALRVLDELALARLDNDLVGQHARIFAQDALSVIVAVLFKIHLCHYWLVATSTHALICWSFVSFRHFCCFTTVYGCP